MTISRKIRTPFRYSFNNASLYIIGANIVVYLLELLFPYLAVYLPLNVLAVVKGHMYWQFFTYMFSHGSVQHLLFNMLGILFFGLAVEKTIGSREYVLFYLLSGAVCGIISFCIYCIFGAFYVKLLGASGAVYALLFAYAVIFPKSQIYIWGILPIPAPLLIAVYAAIEIISQFAGRGGIAHMTHLAGFIFAWLYFIIRMGIHPLNIWKKNMR